MYAFINGEIDVLVSTTIIETGLDISNVNTMIIHDSDRLWTFTACTSFAAVSAVPTAHAFAFLMYRRNVMLKEDSRKTSVCYPGVYRSRKPVFKIAMRDLETPWCRKPSWVQSSMDI